MTYDDNTGCLEKQALSANKRNAIVAYEKGYRISEDGSFINPKGKELPIKCHAKCRYPRFTVTRSYKVLSFSLHHLAAYCFYGIEGLQEQAVRHVNGNKLDLSRANIVPGTHAQNNQDVPPAVRKAKAILARKSQGFTPTNAKLLKEQVEEIRKFYCDLAGQKAANGTVAALARKFGVSRTVLTHIKNRKYYPNV